MKSRILLYSFLFLFTSFFISNNIFGQSFILLDTNNVTLNNGDTIIVTGDTAFYLNAIVYVKNISLISKSVGITRTKLNEIPGSNCIFAWGLNMYDTSTIQGLSIPIAAGAIETSFYSLYYSNGIFGSSLYKYNFFDENNPADSAWIIIQYNVINTTGIDENALNNFTFFPNPGNGLYYLSFPEHNKSSISTELFNSAGDLIIIKNYTQNNSPYIIDLLNYTDGIYFLKIYDEKKQYYKTVKLVKIQ